MRWHRTEKQRGDGAGPHCGEGEASCQNPCWERGEVRQYMEGGSATHMTQGPVGPTLSTAPEQHKRPEKHTGDNQSWQQEWSENGLQGMGPSRREQGAGVGSSRAQGQ